LSARLIADKIGVFDQRRRISGRAGDLFEHLSVLAFEPLPIAQLMKREVVGVEQVHSSVGAESVRNNRNTVV